MTSAEHRDTNEPMYSWAKEHRTLGTLARTVPLTTSDSTVISNRWSKSWDKDTASPLNQNCEKNSVDSYSSCGERLRHIERQPCQSPHAAMSAAMPKRISQLVIADGSASSPRRRLSLWDGYGTGLLRPQILGNTRLVSKERTKKKRRPRFKSQILQLLLDVDSIGGKPSENQQPSRLCCGF